MKSLTLCERIRSITDKRDPTLYPLLEEFMHGRWNKLNMPFHMATFGLNTKLYDIEKTKRSRPAQDIDVVKGFLSAVKKIFGSIDEASNMRIQFAHFLYGRRQNVWLIVVKTRIQLIGGCFIMCSL